MRGSGLVLMAHCWCYLQFGHGVVLPKMASQDGVESISGDDGSAARSDESMSTRAAMR